MTDYYDERNILSEMIKYDHLIQKFYDTLRTKETLGYIVQIMELSPEYLSENQIKKIIEGIGI